MNETLMKTAEARDLLRVSRAMFCRLQKRSGFPRPVRFGARCLRWRVSELLAFAEASQGRK
jgi:predicted DNA-binding transcriptional regulator AlpA